MKEKIKEHDIKVKRGAAVLRKLRSRSIPTINRVAQEYGAEVEILDKDAYIFKTIKGDERGAHIPYGSHPMEIRRRLDKAFLGSSTLSKVKSAGRTIKRAKKTLDSVRKELKAAGFGQSSMYGDPSKMFR